MESFSEWKPAPADEGDAATAIGASKSEVREQLARILASRTFRIAEGQKAFLRYAVESVIDGRLNQLKEYCVGTDVFHRGDGFDPRKDNIVRVEARRLRQRLARYYQLEGPSDPVTIDFPKGSYVPTFARRQADRPAAPASLLNQTPLDETPLIETLPEPGSLPSSEVDSSPNRIEPSSVPTPARFFRAWQLAAALAMLVAVGSVAYFLGRRDRDARPVDRSSVLVLPFLSENHSDDFFGDGLTDELIDLLGRVPGLHVVARTSAFEFKGKPLDVRKIARQLHVGTVMDGSIRNSGGKLRVVAHLYDGANGYQIWARSYDRDSKDMLNVQQDISQAIVSALGVQLAGVTSGTESPEAYLKGIYFSNKHTAQDNEKAIDYFEQATALDPGYARAYARLARCYGAITFLTSTPPRDVVAKMKAAAAKAMELDGTVGEAHIELGVSLAYQSDWPAAEREMKKGIALSPGDAAGHVEYSGFLARAGRLKEALTEARVGLDLDPVSPARSLGFAAQLYRARRYDEAIQEFQKALDLQPDFAKARLGLGLVYLQVGNYDKGIEETRAARTLMGDDPNVLGQLGYAYGLSGDRAGALGLLTNLLGRANRGAPVALPVAEVYIGLRDKEHAFEWLRKAVGQQGRNCWLKAEPIYDPIDSDPRFADLLHRVDLM